MTKYIKIYMCFCFLFIFVKCANIITPSGGPKDTEPPRVIKESPVGPAVNFNEKNIELEFNEFIQVKNIQNIQLSPTCEPPPKIEQKGKKLIIKLMCELDSLLTYTLSFGTTISDLNEGNILKNYSYVFSKNSTIDSLFLQAEANESYTGKSVTGALVLLSKEIDSLTPLYYSYTDENGSCLIKNISFQDYYLYGFLDLNSNLKHDDGELTSVPQKISTLNQSLKIEMFDVDQVNKINEVKQIHKNAIQFQHSFLSDQIKVLNCSGSWKKSLKTSWFWFDENVDKIIYEHSSFLDSINIFNQDTLSSLELTFPKLTYEVYDSAKIIIETNAPIKMINKEKVLIDGGKFLSFPKIIDPFRIEINVDTSSLNKPVSIVINDGAILCSNNLINDSTSFNLDFSKDKYGFLNIKSLNVKDNAVVELFNDSGVVRTLELKDSLSIGWIKPGNYKLRTFIDNNKNMRWDAGTLTPPNRSEEIQIHPQIIRIKENWDLEVQIDLNENF
tara:strand:+ start:2226 stop:3728 length:1503 start_codon:yes stop_codon:yes gene_type:complete